MGDALLFTTDANNNKAEENIIDPSGRIVASKRFDGAYANEYYFYRYDVRGSVTNITDKDGMVVKGYEYDAYGNTVEKGDAQFKNSTKFTGAVQDQGTGLYYMNARHYNPSTGRFLQQDTYTGDPAEPWTQHLYAYAGNNPVNMVDPTGHSFFSALFKSLSNVAKSFLKIPQVRKAAAKVITAATRAVSRAVSASISSASSSKGKKRKTTNDFQISVPQHKKMTDSKEYTKYMEWWEGTCAKNGMESDIDKFIGDEDIDLVQFRTKVHDVSWPESVAVGGFTGLTTFIISPQSGFAAVVGSFATGAVSALVPNLVQPPGAYIKCGMIISKKDNSGFVKKYEYEFELKALVNNKGEFYPSDVIAVGQGNGVQIQPYPYGPPPPKVLHDSDDFDYYFPGAP